MISLPFRRFRPSANIDALYGAIVAQARSPAFYRNYGVPDTVAGRLEMVVLHLVLLLSQWRAAEGRATAESQELFDRFCQDIDDNFREMGMGDLAVPGEMRKVAEVFYGRAKAYEAALSTDDPSELERAIDRNVFGSRASAVGAARLAAYMREAVRRLGAQESAWWTPGAVDFPRPEAVAAPVVGEGLAP